jgi:hypothetical protein
MATRGTLWSFSLFLGLMTGILTTRMATAQENIQQVVILDECDPTTFNRTFGPDTCHNVVSGGGVVLKDFLAALPTGDPAWLFFPTNQLEIEEGDTLRASSTRVERYILLLKSRRTAGALYRCSTTLPIRPPSRSAPEALSTAQSWPVLA